MFGRWLKSAAEVPVEPGEAELLRVVREQLRDADDESVRVVAAIAGLLALVAYADRDWSDDEERSVRAELARVHGMTRAGVDAICDVLQRHVLELATVQAPRLTRELRELADDELRRDVLEVLVDVAAADGVITHAEVNVLRQLTTSLGLDQADYNAIQAKHRDKLSVLR